MRRRNKKFDLYIVAGLAIITIGYFVYNHVSSEQRGVKAYSAAIESYKKAEYEKAYKEFSKVPSGSCLKSSALFRQARCATNLGKKELAIKKYKKIAHSNSKSSIVPISEYNMATLLLEIKSPQTGKHFKHIIKKHPTSDYAIAAEYYIGLIESENLPKSEKRRQKAIDNALIKFKSYLEKAPDGRFAMQSLQSILNFEPKLNNYDNLLIAKTYYLNGEYQKAQEFLNKTTLAESWPEFVKNASKLGLNDKVRYYTELGLKEHSNSVKSEDIYEAVDAYIATFDSRKDGINNLVSKNYKENGSDYISFMNCNELVPANTKDACFRTLYEKYPNGQFSAEALYNLMITKYLQKKYLDAQRLGFLHIKKFPRVKSSPAVIYYMGKISHKLKHYESSNSYYKQVIRYYPDSYYAYRAHYNLYKGDGALPYDMISQKPVVFPYKKSMDNNLVIKLALLKDYDLVEELCKKDKFIQSWIAYQKGNYTISALLARNAMEDLAIKPPFDDLRWRLVYPLHYYDLVYKYKNTNNPIILQSILKEESHFNQYAGSSVGAKGLMQLMDGTYKDVASAHSIIGDIYIPENNIRAGSYYYESLKKVLGSKDLYAISAYNGGIGSVTTWFSKLIYSDTDEFVEQIPYPETKNYVKKVLRTYWVYGNIY